MHKNNKLKKLLSMVMAMSMVFSLAATASAAETEAGTYNVDADMSLYVDAMGGVEFADSGLFENATITVDDDGNKSVTVNFAQGSGNIYGVAYTAFIDAAYQPKYYNANHETVDVTSYTKASGTMTKNSAEVDYEYVTSMTFPLEVDTAATVFDTSAGAAVSAGNTADSDTVVINLWVVLNSNVMGMQFCDGSGTAGSETYNDVTKYVAALTLDLSNLPTSDEEPEESETPEETVTPETSSQTANVIYNVSVEGSYEVSIPASIVVGEDKTGTYTVELIEFVAPTGSYVTVTADTAGTLACGEATLAFTNALTSGNLDAVGETLSGTVTVTEDATVSGEYTGTLNFTINYYEG